MASSCDVNKINPLMLKVAKTAWWINIRENPSGKSLIGKIFEAEILFRTFSTTHLLCETILNYQDNVKSIKDSDANFFSSREKRLSINELRYSILNFEFRYDNVWCTLLQFLC